MPVIRRSTDQSRVKSNGVTVTTLLDPQITHSDRCAVSRLILQPEATRILAAGAGELVWLVVLSGEGEIDGEPIDQSSVISLLPGSSIAISARQALELLQTTVPRADRFDAGLPSGGTAAAIVDWSREPVLRSEHDARTRTYLATPSLTGTTAIKAERITYPPGTCAPEHHHEGAEHFQYIVSGRGTAVLDGEPHALAAGDILYNYEREPHYFLTDPAATDDFVFVEVFVPGTCKTVWAEEAKACAWLPTGKDARGRQPVREIAYHVHGDDRGL